MHTPDPGSLGTSALIQRIDGALVVAAQLTDGGGDGHFFVGRHQD
jgi:hypothetical protein